MFRLLFPIILIIGAVLGFMRGVSPLYKDIQSLREQVASYDQALQNSKALEAERDRLTQKFNSMSPEDLDKIQKMIPDSVDNIRLILEVEKLASPYGMTLKDVKYDAKAGTSKKTTAGESVAVQGGQAGDTSRDYGSWDLEFAVDGRYSDLLSFLQDLEHNLRIVDLTSIKFNSIDTVLAKDRGLSPTSLNEIYHYSFRVKTYWLKN